MQNANYSPEPRLCSFVAAQFETSLLNVRSSAEEVDFEPKQTLQSKQVKRSSHEWINKFIIANLISVIISIIRSSDE